jgi:hypothetical protein
MVTIHNGDTAHGMVSRDLEEAPDDSGEQRNNKGE